MERIGIDLTFLRNSRVGGIKVYALSLINELIRLNAATVNDWEFLLYIPHDVDLPLEEIPGRFIWQRVPIRGGAALVRYLWMQTAFPLQLRRDRVTLLHSMAYVGPVFAPAKRIVTVHDLNFLAWGNQMPWSRRVALKAICTAASSRATRVLTVSETMRSDISRYLRVPPERVGVIPNSAGAHFSEHSGATHGKHDQIVAFSGTPNKNTATSIRVIAAVAERVPADGVIIGALNEDSRAVLGSLPLAVRNRIRTVEYPTDEELRAVVSESKVLLFPSTYEGFGIPVLEAQAVQTAVICSNCASLPEVAGRGAAIFDAHDVDGMAGCAVELLVNEARRRDLVARGTENWRRYSWKSSAEMLIWEYRELLNEGTSRPCSPNSK